MEVKFLIVKGISNMEIFKSCEHCLFVLDVVWKLTSYENRFRASKLEREYLFCAHCYA